jgi:hypothetical protein
MSDLKSGNKQKKMFHKNLPDFLQSCKVEKNDKKIPSHTVLGDKELNLYPGKYYISEEKKEFFYELYSKWIFMWEQEHYLTEKHHDEYSPVLIDLDFRYNKPKENIDKRKYNIEDIIFFVSKFLEILSSYIEIDDKDKNVFIMEKSGPIYDESKKIMKDGVHIIMPNIVSKYDPLFLTRHEILKEDSIIKKFKEIGFTNPIDDIVDEAVIKRNNWFMYGSCKPGKESYEITNTIQFKGLEYEILEDKKMGKSDLELVKLFSVFNFQSDKICKIKNESKIKNNLEKIEGKKKKNLANKKIQV